MRSEIQKALRAALETNPLNDWLLARVVAAIFMFDCFVITILKA